MTHVPTKPLCFIFPLVKYSPISQFEVAKCAKNFTETAAECIEQLHGLGYAHCDIRLPNICFNEQFNAVLIDLDRAESMAPFGEDWKDLGGILESCTKMEENLAVWDEWNALLQQLLAGDPPNFDVLNGKDADGQVKVKEILTRR